MLRGESNDLNGDPHFRTWSGLQFDFHGGCDLVLLNNPSFADGLGLTIHIRTAIQTWWSYIATAAIQIGDEILEVTGGTGKIPYYINGVLTDDMKTGDATLAGFNVHFRRTNDLQSHIRIDLGNGDAISFETFKSFVRVNVNDKTGKSFANSVGLLGSYPTGQKIARDGETIMEDANEFGREWQVRASEPHLFQEVVGPQHPAKCTMPDETKKATERRRLGEAVLTENDAAMACSHIVSNKDRDGCIFDVLATNDLDMAGSY